MSPKTVRGFTVIEVMIVLAIAALILGIVLLAVPSMQRSRRNLSRHRDAQFILSERDEFDQSGSAGASRITNVAGSYTCPTPSSGFFCPYISNNQLSYYDPANVTFASTGLVPPATVPSVTDPAKLLTTNYLKCNSDQTTAAVAASPSSFVVLFAVEAPDGPQTQCIEGSLAITQVSLSTQNL